MYMSGAWPAIFLASIWWLWCDRNMKIMGNVTCSKVEVVRKITRIADEILKKAFGRGFRIGFPGIL